VNTSGVIGAGAASFAGRTSASAFAGHQAAAWDERHAVGDDNGFDGGSFEGEDVFVRGRGRALRMADRGEECERSGDRDDGLAPAPCDAARRRGDVENSTDALLGRVISGHAECA
jgi:hypothetical protein